MPFSRGIEPGLAEVRLEKAASGTSPSQLFPGSLGSKEMEEGSLASQNQVRLPDPVTSLACLCWPLPASMVIGLAITLRTLGFQTRPESLSWEP